MTTTAIDLLGQRFGELTIIERAGSNGKHATWLARCDCGNLKVVQHHRLADGRARSCGDRRRHPCRRGATGRPACYTSAHALVRRLYGPAGAHPCLFCGGPAETWALVHNRPAEQLTEGGLRWSPNPLDYAPLCRRDHARYDAKRRT